MAETTKQTTTTAKAKKPETVSVKLPRNKGKDAVQEEFFSVNFKNYLIKRGVYVEVPIEVYEVIENAEKAEDYAVEYAEAKAVREP